MSNWPVHLVLGGTLFNSKMMECYDWADLLASPGKDGQNRKIPGIDGTEVRRRTGGELNAAIGIRLNGSYMVDDPLPGDREFWIERYLSLHFNTIRPLTESNNVHGLTLHTPAGEYIASKGCQIESGGTPNRLNPWTWEYVLDLTLPGGALVEND